MRSWGLVTVTAVVLAAATACGGGTPSAAGSSPTPLTSSAAVTTSTEPSVSASPASTLDPNSDAAILAAVQAYAAGFQAAVRSGSMQPYAAVTTPDCNCRQQVSSVVTQLASAQETTNVVFAVSAARIINHVDTKAEVVFTLTNDSYSVFDRAARPIATGPSAKNNDDVSFELEGTRWLAYLSS